MRSRPLTEAPEADDRALGQVERAVAATLEHHAHLRLMPAAARASQGRVGRVRRLGLGSAAREGVGMDEGLPIAYQLVDRVCG